MSHIFDALQRSEAERSGAKKVATVATATELLERAERQALLQWEAEVVRSETSEQSYTDSDLGSIAPHSQLEELTRRDLESGESIRVTELANAFRQFEEVDNPLSEKNRLVCLTDKESPAAEAFRLLKVRLRNFRKNRFLKTVLITSSVPQEGKSFVAANLACTLASGSTEKVLLLGGDLRRPAVSQLFGVSEKPGICEVLEKTNELPSSIYRLVGPGLWFLPAGKTKGNPMEIIHSGRLPSLMKNLAEWFDWIIVDSPPMLPLADTTAWARLADGILFVVRRDVTEKQELTKVLAAIESSKLIGAILNSSKNASDKGQYYYYRDTEVKENTTVILD